MEEYFESAPGIMLEKVGAFGTPEFIHRHPENPILTCDKMPYDSHMVFNSSVTEFNAKYSCCSAMSGIRCTAWQKNVSHTWDCRE